MDTGGTETRRVVTVLFADVVGFTSLAEQLDPEQVKRLVDSAFELLVADVESHGGVVDKLLGDAIVALFGAPVAHEDDADRAVRAGIAMQQTLGRFRDEHPADDLRIRIGINTGEVLMGTLVGSDYTAMGDVVNTASRLQSVAPVDGILVGGATRALCDPNIRFRRVDDVQLRGRVGQVDVWQVVAVDQANPRRRWSSDVPFVGRAAELSILKAVTKTVASGRSAIVAVSGEAGIGKSRLLGEAIAGLVNAFPDTFLLEGACAPYGETNVWWPVAGGVLQHLGLDRNLDDGDPRERVVECLSPFDELRPGTAEFERVVEFVLHLTGHPSALDHLGPVAVRDAVVNGMVSGLRNRAEKSPVVIWVDDVQWAAPVLLDLLESLARQLAHLPVLIATTLRADGDVSDAWPPAADPALSLHLSLEPLPEDEADELVCQAAGADLDPAVRTAIATRSGGNPLFLIELARLAVSSTESVELPGSLRALVAAQLDRLSPAQREVIDNAAVIGNEGRVASLRAFAEHLGQTYDPQSFTRLCELGLLVRDGRRWRFRSDVVREVAYQTLTKQVRAQRHAGVANYLTKHEPQSIDLRAHHMASAAELQEELGPIPGVPADATETAVDWLAQAAGVWQRQGASRRGLRVAERASRLVVRPSASARKLALLEIELLIDLHRYREARDLIADLRPSAEVHGDRVIAASLSRLLGMIEQMEGDLVAARRELSAAAEAFRELDDPEHLAEALRCRGFAEVFGGSLADAERFLSEADELYVTTVDDPRGAAWVQQNLAWVSFLAGDHEVSQRRLEAAIEAFEDIDDRGGRAWSLGLLAYVHHFNRRNDEALELAEAALADAKRWGDPWGIAMMLNLQASVKLWRGEVSEARELAERALAGFRKIEDRFGQIQALGIVSRAMAASGRIADADRSVEEVLSLSGAFGELAYPGMAAAGTAMHLGRGPEVVKLASEAQGRLDTTGANVDEGRVIGAFGHLLCGDQDAALTDLVDVDVERSPFALAARATLAALVGDRERALADADAIECFGEVSYWDRIVGLAAAYAVATGDDRVERRARLERASAELDDVIVTAYIDRLLVGSEDASTHRRAVDIGQWSNVADRLARIS
jgi:class 3 adenylate cyclase/tetratricopeptide (TPR) repeat protein